MARILMYSLNLVMGPRNLRKVPRKKQPQMFPTLLGMGTKRRILASLNSPKPRLLQEKLNKTLVRWDSLFADFREIQACRPMFTVWARNQVKVAERSTKYGNVCVMFPKWWTEGPMHPGNRQSSVCPMNRPGTAKCVDHMVTRKPRPGPWARQIKDGRHDTYIPVLHHGRYRDVNHYYQCDQCARIRGRNPTSCVLGHLHAGSICCISPD